MKYNSSLFLSVNILIGTALALFTACDGRNKSSYWETQTRRNTDYEPAAEYDTTLKNRTRVNTADDTTAIYDPSTDTLRK